MATTPARIDGQPEWGERTMTVQAPWDGQVLGEVPDLGAPHVDRAVAGARRALTDDTFPAWERAAVLDRAAARLADPAVVEDLATTIALEVAKPITTARTEVARAASTFQFAAASCRTLTGEVLPLDAAANGQGRLGLTLRIPIGVIGAITPFNFPLNLVVHKVAPAIAAGCPIVLKPAHQAPLTALRLADLLIDECGLPPAWLHVVTGDGPTAGAALVAHPDVAMITFTGSPDVGWGIRAAAPRKKVALELGNASPLIIDADSDWQEAAQRVAQAGYGHAGQTCISVQRVLVHRTIEREFTARLCDHVDELVVGDPLDAATQVSALIDQGARDRVRSWVDEATAEGARVRTGGTIDDHGCLRPTVVTEVKPHMRLCRDEVFGPVVGVAAYDAMDEAIALANDTRYGLHAGIFTRSIDVARHAMRALDFGGVIINDVPSWRGDQMPYGGLRDSGNAREGPAYSIQEMTETRAIVFA